MARYRLTKQAQIDITDIWVYSSTNWSEQQADRYINAFIKAFMRIAQTPKIGKKYFYVVPGIYGMHTMKHIIFYKIIDESMIEVTRVLHERMDWQKRLED